MAKERAKAHVMNMCEGPILKKLLLFAIPLMASSLLQLLFNAADIIVVGQFAGKNSLAAVGSTSSLINLLVNLFMGLSVGANVLVAQFFGAKKEKELSETIHTAIMLSLISGVVLMFVGIIGAPYILNMMQTPKEVLDLAVVYLQIYFVGMPAMMLYNFGAAILRAIGDTKRPLYYLFAAGVVNVAFNMIFVIVFHWDVFGVGLATTISQMISALLVLRCLMKETGALQLQVKSLKIHKDKLLKILQIGLPAGFQGTLFSLSNVFIQSSINSFGATVIAGNSAASNIEGFVYVSMNAFHQATISFTSQNYGARKYKRIGRILLLAELCTVIVGTFFGAGAYLAGPVLLRLYTTSSAVVDAGMVRLLWICVPYALCGIMDVMVGALRGIGCSVVPMFVSLIGVCALRLVWLGTVFQIDKYHRIETVYVIYTITWTITAIAHLITFLMMKNRIQKRRG